MIPFLSLKSTTRNSVKFETWFFPAGSGLGRIPYIFFTAGQIPTHASLPVRLIGCCSISRIVEMCANRNGGRDWHLET